MRKISTVEGVLEIAVNGKKITRDEIMVELENLKLVNANGFDLVLFPSKLENLDLKTRVPCFGHGEKCNQKPCDTPEPYGVQRIFGITLVSPQTLDKSTFGTYKISDKSQIMLTWATIEIPCDNEDHILFKAKSFIPLKRLNTLDDWRSRVSTFDEKQKKSVELSEWNKQFEINKKKRKGLGIKVPSVPKGHRRIHCSNCKSSQFEKILEQRTKYFQITDAYDTTKLIDDSRVITTGKCLGCGTVEESCML